MLKLLSSSKEKWFGLCLAIQSDFCQGTKDLIDPNSYPDLFYSYYNQYHADFQYEESDYVEKLKRVIENIVLIMENNILHHYYMKQRLDNSKI